MPPTPDDLVTIERAAELVGRPAGTVRRWTREPAGAPRLTTWPGPVPTGGGHPARLVSLDAVRALAGGDAPSPSAVPTNDAGDVERLRADLDTARAELDRERHAHATTRASLDAERSAHASTREDLAGVRAELAAARDLVARLDTDRERDNQAHNQARADLVARLDATDRERRGLQVAHVAATTALAALSADVERYARLGMIGRALQAPPAVRQLPGPLSGLDPDHLDAGDDG